MRSEAARCNGDAARSSRMQSDAMGMQPEAVGCTSRMQRHIQSESVRSNQKQSEAGRCKQMQAKARHIGSHKVPRVHRVQSTGSQQLPPPLGFSIGDQYDGPLLLLLFLLGLRLGLRLLLHLRFSRRPCRLSSLELGSLLALPTPPPPEPFVYSQISSDLGGAMPWAYFGNFCIIRRSIRIFTARTTGNDSNYRK